MKQGAKVAEEAKRVEEAKKANSPEANASVK